jgi:hypothetical protein
MKPRFIETKLATTAKRILIFASLTTFRRYVIQYGEGLGRATYCRWPGYRRLNRTGAAFNALEPALCSYLGPHHALVQASGQPGQSFLVLLPIYPPRNTTPETEAGG